MTSSPKPRDRRVQRTRLALRDALFDLLTEQAWDDVQVQDVCARANVGRSTFYMHFADKEELLLSGLDDLQAELRATVAAAGGAPLAFVRPMIEHVISHEKGGQRDRLRVLLTQRPGHAIRERLLALVVDVLAADLPARPSRSREAALRGLAGAFVEMLAWWITTRPRLPPSELEAIYRRIALPALRALRR